MPALGTVTAASVGTDAGGLDANAGEQRRNRRASMRWILTPFVTLRQAPTSFPTRLQPMPYLGGKSQSGVYQRIINLIPPHRTYIEPFLGGGAIMRLKKQADLSYGIDLAPRGEVMPPDGTARVFVQGCGIEFLERYDFRGCEFVYADPPYVHSTRKSRARYEHEMTDADHARLLNLLRALPCPVLLSGYPSAMYDEALAGWGREEFQVMTRGHTWATEVLWFNYPRPAALHDVGYVGTDYRDRLRIKRKRARWAARLARMPALERAALFSARVDARRAGGDASFDATGSSSV